MLRRLLPAAVLLIVSTASAFAQLPMGLTLHDQPKELTPEQRAKQKAIDDAYRAAAGKIPDKSRAADPWGSVRPSPSSGSGRSGN